MSSSLTLQKLSSTVVEPVEQHTATVIWLHGLGDTGVGWLFLTEELAPRFPYIRWILPNAPLKKITSFGDEDGVLRNAWFNINGFDKRSHMENIDDKGMLHSRDLVVHLIEEEIKNGVPKERIVLGGFSQGCVISLLAAVSIPHKIAGIIGCSGWLPLGEEIDKFGSNMNKQIPLMICHGKEDEVVKFRFGRASARFLAKKGYNVQFKEYPTLPHAADADEISDISNFISQHLPPLKSTAGSKL